MSSRSSSSQRSGVSARQIHPRAWVAMKLIASGVTCSAAMARSPSFSRSSSSRTRTILPWRKSSIASSTLQKDADGFNPLVSGGWLLAALKSSLQQALDVLGDDVDFDVDGRTDRLGRQHDHLPRV